MFKIDQIKEWYRGVPLRLALRLLILPFSLSVLDFCVTLSFQPAEYWEGDRTAVLEANPLARWVLMLHPLLVIPTVLIWYVIMFPLIFKTPTRIGLRVIAVHLFGHVIAVSGWLLRMHENGVWWVCFLVILVGMLTVILLGPYRRQWNGATPVR